MQDDLIATFEAERLAESRRDGKAPVFAYSYPSCLRRILRFGTWHENHIGTSSEEHRQVQTLPGPGISRRNASAHRHVILITASTPTLQTQ